MEDPELDADLRRRMRGDLPRASSSQDAVRDAEREFRRHRAGSLQQGRWLGVSSLIALVIASVGFVVIFLS